MISENACLSWFYLTLFIFCLIQNSLIWFTNHNPETKAILTHPVLISTEQHDLRISDKLLLQ